jgi:hypothetical protein
MVQNNKVIKTSKGAQHIDSIFFRVNRKGDSVMSAKKPATKVAIEIASPIFVRY